MGRRKKIIEDDGDSSEGDRPGEDEEDGIEAHGVNADLAEEAALFANPYGTYGRKKRRRTKEDTIYGIFGDDDKDDGGTDGRKQNSRYMSGVRFVSGGNIAGSRHTDSDDDTSTEHGSSGEEDNNGPRQNQDPMDIEEETVSRGGLGSGSLRGQIADEDGDEGWSGGRPGLGTNFGGRRGLGNMEDDEQDREQTRIGLGGSSGGGVGIGGSSRAGLGLSEASADVPADLPTAFGSTRTKSRSSSNSPVPRYQPVDRDFGRFERSTKGIGSKLLEKMGWRMGMGLGKEGTGIAAPIDVKLRPKGAGLGMVDERTEAIKNEQWERQAEGLEEDEEEPTRKTELRTGQWKQGARKQKKTYKSAEELVAEQESGAGPPVGAVPTATKILDMTGPEVRELSDISQITSATAAFDITAARLPELRHNVKLLADLAQHDLLHVGRQMRIEKTRQEQLGRQEKIISQQVNDEKTRIVRLQAVVELANECERTSKRFSFGLGELDLEELIEAFSIPFQKLQTEHFEEYQTYGLDELVVASLAPIVKKTLHEWQPLADPTYGAEAFRQWKRLLMAPAQRSGKGQDVNTGAVSADHAASRKMTPYEAMMYDIWLPKVRQAINNEWSPQSPDSVITLLEAWHPQSASTKSRIRNGVTEDGDQNVLLPSWLYQNMLEQLILPKLTREVDNWNLSQDPVAVHTWVHPWLPHLVDRMEGIFTTIRHKLVGSLKDWHPRDPSALLVLMPWKEVFDQVDMESLLAKAILPKLILTLRNDFEVNPRAQDLEPLQWVFAWCSVVPAHLLVHLFETEFFPKWHKVLWAWLSSPQAKNEEITMWYKSWKGVFPPELAKEAGIVNQFRAGLDMMNRSLAMGGARGPMPAAPPPIASMSQTAAAGGKVGSGTARRAAAPAMSAMDSFRDYVERKASERDLLFAPANRVHPTTGKALFRLAPAARAATGTGGLIGYIDEGVIFVDNRSGGWDPMSVEEAMEMAKGKAKGKGSA
ncbi:hypothetical protein SpCBS45565_g02497 [Spizellomyces sp. 'palustris']|nr:hypothetical protein SpCBS45565_g02497 [Spizellomyces sp. 'palustris']